VNIDIESLPRHIMLGKVETLSVIHQGQWGKPGRGMVHKIATRGAGDSANLSSRAGDRCNTGGARS